MMPTDAVRADLPSTLQRSPEKAQRTYKETLESAEDQYNGDESRAHRVAYASLKHSFEKVGDHWEAKDHTGPSDTQAEQSGRDALEHPRPTAEGVDANASKAHLMALARRLDVAGRSRMRKEELVDAIKRANRQRSAQARR
jgi:cation transport regulator ChaB